LKRAFFWDDGFVDKGLETPLEYEIPNFARLPLLMYLVGAFGVCFYRAIVHGGDDQVAQQWPLCFTIYHENKESQINYAA
jgi:hypothetical protein